MGLTGQIGKLTPNDIKSLFLLLPQLENERLELQAAIAKEPEKFASEFLSTGFTWAHLYEVPFLQFLSAYLSVAGLCKVVTGAAAADNPVQAMFALPDEIEDIDWSGGDGGGFTRGDLLGYLHALAGNLECLLIYGSYLNDLVAEAKRGDLNALYKAIRIDTSVVTGPTARNLLSVAVITGDREFIDEIRKAMSGKTDKQSKYLNKFRLLMQVLHELNELGRPTKEIMEFVFEVGAYERAPGADKAISEQIRKAKPMKNKSISK